MKSNNFKRLKIGVIGVGTVGEALKYYFEKKGKNLFLYDKYKNLGSPEQVNQADLVFICVPTPYEEKKGFDLSFVKEAVSGVKNGKIVVIKSTVLPGSTEKIQKENPQKKILFSPEFLTGSTAKKDVEFPDRQIVGYTKTSREVAQDVLKILASAPFEKIMPARSAELVKYFSNTIYATKVVFANQIYDICQKLDIDYGEVKEAALADKRICPGHFEVWHKGYRGYGGKCLPKDIKALIQLGDELGINLKLHKAVEEVNNQLLSEK